MTWFLVCGDGIRGVCFVSCVNPINGVCVCGLGFEVETK